jgi:methylated-DNA-[protein]-cysteine S-methyltransferase
VPCHRVIAASGALTGFAGGLDIKAFLLTLEAKAYVRALEAGDPVLLHAG